MPLRRLKKRHICSSSSQSKRMGRSSQSITPHEMPLTTRLIQAQAIVSTLMLPVHSKLGQRGYPVMPAATAVVQREQVSSRSTLSAGPTYPPTDEDAPMRRQM